MIGRISSGNNFTGLLSYLLDPEKNPRIISKCLQNLDIPAMAYEFREISNLNPRIAKPVKHFSVSFAESDGEVSDCIKEAVTLKLLNGLGHQDCQYISIDHNRYDPKHLEAHNHDHFHIITNRVDVDGHLVKDSWEAYKMQTILRECEQELGLKKIASSWEVNKRKTDQEFQTHPEFSALISDSLKNSSNLKSWLTQLDKNNIDTRFNLTNKGVVRGISFLKEGKVFKGGDIGANWKRVEEILGSNSGDLQLMEAANIRSQERPVELSKIAQYLFDQATSLAMMKLNGIDRFESNQVKIKCDGEILIALRIRPKKLIFKANKTDSGWDPIGFPNIDKRDIILLERINNIKKSEDIVEVNTAILNRKITARPSTKNIEDEKTDNHNYQDGWR